MSDDCYLPPTRIGGPIPRSNRQHSQRRGGKYSLVFQLHGLGRYCGMRSERLLFVSNNCNHGPWLPSAVYNLSLYCPSRVRGLFQCAPLAELILYWHYSLDATLQCQHGGRRLDGRPSGPVAEAAMIFRKVSIYFLCLFVIRICPAQIECNLKGGYELAELVVLSEPHTQLQGSAPLSTRLQQETLRSLFCLPSFLLTSRKNDFL